MRKSTLYSSILLALMLFGFGLVRDARSQSDNLKVSNYSWYIDSVGGFDVVGEVQNVGSSTLNPVVIGGIVYTPDGTAQVWSNPCVVYVNYMLPQQKAPFLMEFPSSDLSWLSQGVDHISFQVIQANVTDKYQYQNLAITNSKLAADAEGVYWVTGTVQNTGTQTATNVRVTATFYNASGTVVAVGYSDPPTNLNPSGSASFKAGAFDVNKTETSVERQISSCSLLVQTEGPLLSGTAPAPSSSSSNSSSTSSSPSTPSASSTDSSSNGGSSNPSPPYERYVVIVVIVVIVIGALLAFKRRKSSKASTEKGAKSQTARKRRQLPRNGYRDV